LAPIGDNARQSIERELAELRVPAHIIASSSPTRTCTTLLDAAGEPVTELVENAHPLGERCLEQFVAAYAGAAAAADVVVLTGSLPAATPATLYADLLKQTRSKAVLDARGAELLAALDERPFLVKPNREELSLTLGRPLASQQDLLAAMREINDRGAQWVVVTEGKRAVWATAGGEAWRLEPLDVQNVVNPIGCGDCLAAGCAWALADGYETLDSLRIGIAAAAQNAAQLLPGRLDPQVCVAQAEHVQAVKVHG
ncbi:MAG: PfkB family carbohydrate kinase, partial [Pirellulales bacterium]